MGRLASHRAGLQQLLLVLHRALRARPREVPPARGYRGRGGGLRGRRSEGDHPSGPERELLRSRPVRLAPLRGRARCARRHGHRALALRDEPSEGPYRRGHRQVRHAALAHAGAPPARAVGLRRRAGRHEPPLHARPLPGARAQAAGRAAGDRALHRHHRGVPRRDGEGLRGHVPPCGRGGLPPGVHVHLLQARGNSCRLGRRSHAARRDPGAVRPSGRSRAEAGLRGEPGRLGKHGRRAGGGRVQARCGPARGQEPEDQTVHAPLPEGTSIEELAGTTVRVRIDEAKTWYLAGEVAEGSEPPAEAADGR